MNEYTCPVLLYQLLPGLTFFLSCKKELSVILLWPVSVQSTFHLAEERSQWCLTPGNVKPGDVAFIKCTLSFWCHHIHILCINLG